MILKRHDHKASSQVEIWVDGTLHGLVFLDAFWQKDQDPAGGALYYAISEGAAVRIDTTAFVVALGWNRGDK